MLNFKNSTRSYDLAKHWPYDCSNYFNWQRRYKVDRNYFCATNVWGFGSVRFGLFRFGLASFGLVLKAHVHVNVSSIRMESEALILSKSRRCLCRGRYCCQIEKPHFYAIAFPEQQFDANNIYIYICIKNRSHKSKPKISGIKKANNKALNR